MRVELTPDSIRKDLTARARERDSLRAALAELSCALAYAFSCSRVRSSDLVVAAMARRAALLLSSMVESALANNTVSDSAEMAGRGVTSASFRVVVGAIAASSGLSSSSDIDFSSFGGDGTSGSLFPTFVDGGSNRL